MSVNIKAGGGENVTPEVTAQTPLVTEILESLVGKVTLANATPETILEGYSAYVGQQLVEGTLKSAESLLGFDNVKIGNVTPAGNGYSLSVNHGLGIVPDLFIIFTTYNFLDEKAYNACSFKAAVITKSVYNGKAAGILKYNGYNLLYEADTSFNQSLSVTNSSVSMAFSSSSITCGFRGGVPLYWIALG